MRIACDFCDATAYGTRDSLQMAGWVRAIFSAPKRTTISACPTHHQEWTERVNEIFTAAKVGGTKIPCFENELEELDMLTDATRTRIAHISSNYIRAQQAEEEGDDRATLRHTLFAAQDISKILEEWQNNQMDAALAASYADSLMHTASAIKGLITKEAKAMIKHIGQFECCILRDAMQMAAQFNNTARMRIDASGLHIGAVDGINASAVWIDIPADKFTPYYKAEEQVFKNDIGIQCEKLYRMLNAYEGDQEISFSLEHRGGDGEFVVTAGALGTLRAYQTSLNHIGKVPDRHEMLSAHPAPASGNKEAEKIRDWLHRIEHMDGARVVSFIHDNEHEHYTIWAVSEVSGEGCVLNSPKVPVNIDKLQTIISLELLQRSIAPECINGDIKFAFGNYTTLFMEVCVNECDVAMAIAPRID